MDGRFATAVVATRQTTLVGMPCSTVSRQASDRPINSASRCSRIPPPFCNLAKPALLPTRNPSLSWGRGLGVLWLGVGYPFFQGTFIYFELRQGVCFFCHFCNLFGFLQPNTKPSTNWWSLQKRTVQIDQCHPPARLEVPVHCRSNSRKANTTGCGRQKSVEQTAFEERNGKF